MHFVFPMKTWFVYLLLCNQKTFYVGVTTDLANRIRQHKTKQVFFTKKFSNVKLVYCEKYTSEIKATKREKQLKGWGQAKKQMLVDGKLGINSCTGLAEEVLDRKNLL